MEYPWRPRPSTSNFCPVCSSPHFPFCPPSHPQFFRPPPPPPDQLFHTPQPPPHMPPPPPPPPSYDPFVDHRGLPPINPYPPPQPGHIPPRPWNGNPNFSKDYYRNSNPVLDYDINCQVGAKRMRFNNVNETYAAADERRLKLIRDHGATSLGFADQKIDFGNRCHEINSRMDQNYGEGQFVYQQNGNHKNVELGRSLHNQTVNNHEYGFKRHGNSENMGYNAMQKHIVQPPLPTSPPPPLPVEPPRFRFTESFIPSPASGPPSFVQSPYNKVSEATTSVPAHFISEANPNSSGYYREGIQAVKMASSKTFKGETEELPPRHLSFDKPKVIDASHILKHPHRANRPDHIVIILRGLPGSGKSYLAKILRDIEIENGGTAPRIHSMDEYFMTEVEKVEESESSRSSGSVRGKKPAMKKVMEYCYEPEMEEAYRSSMLKAFKKTLDKGAFPFVIVDDRNLRVENFAQFWATAKRSGYEVYLLEATYKDPAGCAARNVHGFTQNDIHKMANQWEEASSLYMKLDVKSLLHGDELEENGIQEVDMDTEDSNCISDPSCSEDTTTEKFSRPFEGYIASDSSPLKDEQERDAAEEHPVEMVKELGKSKWSNDLDEDDSHKSEATRGKSSALSSLIKSYGKKGKSVRWADQIGRIGFSIGSGKTANVSLVIGPGFGYNLKSNPLPEEEKLKQRSGEFRRPNIFQEQLRAERESFRAVFDKRKQRIGGLGVDEE